MWDEKYTGYSIHKLNSEKTLEIKDTAIVTMKIQL